MDRTSLLHRRDLKCAICFLLGIVGFRVWPYAGSRWLPELTSGMILLSGLLMIAFFVLAIIAGGALLLRPFLSGPRDLRWNQGLLRLVCAVAIAAVVKWQHSWPNPASVGDWHRLKDRGNPEDFRAFAKWFLKRAAENPAMAGTGMDEPELAGILSSAEGAEFASIAGVWGVPGHVYVEDGSPASAVSLVWGGGFGHWSVLVRFDAEPVEPDRHWEVRKWQEGLYFCRETGVE